MPVPLQAFTVIRNHWHPNILIQVLFTQIFVVKGHLHICIFRERKLPS